MVAVVATEWWERVRDRWQRRLGGSPRRTRALLIANAVAVVVVIVAAAAQDGFARGLGVWLSCVAMLLGWLAITPTKTVRWVSMLRLFSVAIVWSFIVAVLSSRLAGRVGIGVHDAGPTVAIAAFVEETLKLAPLAMLGILAPGRVRRFAAVDWLLAGLACGMGFQVAEDFVRQAVPPPPPSILDLLAGSTPVSPQQGYGLTLFGGGFVSEGVAYAGHHIETALVAAAIGLAIRIGWQRGAKRWIWVLPPLMWLLVVCDHVGLNAVNLTQDPTVLTSGRSTVPTLLVSIWSWTGHGAERGWLLLGVLAIGLLVDARAQQHHHPGDTSGLRTSDPPASPGAATAAAVATVAVSTAAPTNPADPADPTPAPVGTSRLGRTMSWFVDGVTHLGAGIVASAKAAIGPWQRGRIVGLRAGVVSSLAGLAAQRHHREIDGAPLRPGPPWLVTRLVTAAVAVTVTGISVASAVRIATHIGPDLHATSRWFAGLLDALGGWWDGMGPGGQALVIGAGIGLLALGGILLFPELLGAGLVLEGGIIVGGTTAAGTEAAIPALIAGTGLTTLAMTGHAASSSGHGGSDDSGSGSGRAYRKAARHQCRRHPLRTACRPNFAESRSGYTPGHRERLPTADCP